MTTGTVPARLPAQVLSPTGPIEAPPKQLKPMLAETGERLKSDPQWRYEPKLDGYRVIAFVDGASVRLQSRRGLDLTPHFPELAADLALQGSGRMILDGEIVALDGEGHPSFNALQNRAQLKTTAEIAAAQRDSPVVFICFDLLHLAGLNLRDSPFAEPPPLHRPTVWLKPRLVAEVSFSDWTPGGALRAPVFVRLRDDIAPRSVRKRAGGAGAAAPAAAAKDPDDGDAEAAAAEAVLEQLKDPANRLDLTVGDARVRLTNLDRVYWPARPGKDQPAVTKRDFLRYLARVARFMLAHLADRPLTMIRMPEGIDGERFFQKHWSQELPEFVESITVFSEHKDDQHRYLLANNLPTLLWLGQVGTLEFHVWHSRAQLAPEAAGRPTDYASSLAALEASILNYPDYLVFDIDPYIYSGKEAPGAEPELNKRGFAVGKRVAFWLRALLKQMSLEAIVKTSGKTGLHVFVPIERSVTFDESRHICETVGRHVMRAHPKDITT